LRPFARKRPSEENSQSANLINHQRGKNNAEFGYYPEYNIASHEQLSNNPAFNQERKHNFNVKEDSIINVENDGTAH